MKKIVALVDFSDVTLKVLQHALTMAQAFNSQVVILHGLQKEPVVVDLGLASPTVFRNPSAESIEADREKLANLSEPLERAGVTVSVQQLPDATAASIVEEAERLGVDLVIVGAHHHSTLYNLFVGSMTGDIVKRAHCPVLVVPNE